MKTTIVCGVLGAGKTTFIRNILKQGAEKTVVLVNDFGSAGIDGEILSAGGIETIELPSGCVCCSLRFDLITTVQKIVDQHNPEHLYIEPSGVASPSGVIDALDSLKIQPVTVIGIVDATEFIDIYETDMYGWFFKSQVTRSDIVLVNKIDLVDKGKKEKTLALIEGLNKNAVIAPTVNAELDRSLLFHETSERKIEPGHDHALQLESITILIKRPVALELFMTLLKKLAANEYGQVIRAKALAQTDQGPYRFDLASRQVTSEPFDKEIKNSRLVVIGKDLKEDEIKAAALN